MSARAAGPAGWRRARVRALAKINLALKVIGKRPDGYHELRTVFQTISLGDTIQLGFAPARRTVVRGGGNVAIADNLMERAARLLLDEMRVAGEMEFRLMKRIPMGAGLGGGSSDAAAVLLALPVLAGRQIPLTRLIELAGQLGSDVPFFLLGGRAVGLGRGTELYPLPDLPAAPGVVVAPATHVSTAEAYAALDRELTSGAQQNIISSFGSSTWCQTWAPAQNDFEAVVFRRHPRLKTLKRRLEKLGAKPAMLTGSGAALFGIFRSPAEVEQAVQSFPIGTAFPISLVSRAQYRALWWRWLQPHVRERVWPLRSWYAQ